MGNNRAFQHTRPETVVPRMRNAKKRIQKYIEDLIAKNLVSNKIKAGDNLLVDYKSNSNELNLLINKKEKAS